MTDPSKRKVDPNATIQIELDQVQLYDPNATPGPGATDAGGRKAPPPLPTPGPMPAGAQAAPPNPAKTIAYVAMILVLVGLAIVGGLLVGTRARGNPDAPAPSTAIAPATTTTPPAVTVGAATPSAAPSASAAPKMLTLPTIEMH